MKLENKLTLMLATTALCAVLGCAAPQAEEVSADPGTAVSSPAFHHSEPVVPLLPATECTFPKEWIGKKIDRDAVAAAAKAVRILHPNDPATMDYSPDRLNVIIDKDDTVTEVKCG